MALTFSPARGMVLMCDFNTCFAPPEMTKKRPVIIVGEEMRGRIGTCLVVPTSTTAPDPVTGFHVQLDPQSLPSRLRGQHSWAKCDMVTTVARWRLDRVMNSKVNGRRQYVAHTVTASDLIAVQKGVLNALGLGSVGMALDESPA